MPSFSRTSRLVSKKDFQSIFAQSDKVSHKCFLARYRLNEKTYPRLGIIIAKHVVKHSVLRNQFRRIIRESFRHHQEMIKGLDLIVIMRSKWSPLDKKVLRNNVDNLWQIIVKKTSN